MKNEKKSANSAVQHAVKNGLLKKPKTCECCKEEKKLHGHHYLNYEKENRLKVFWLCHQCHFFAHFLKRRNARILKGKKRLVFV